jgi:hypothetical protein
MLCKNKWLSPPLRVIASDSVAIPDLQSRNFNTAYPFFIRNVSVFMNHQWMSLFLSARKSNQKELVAAQFSIKGCAVASFVLSEN